MSLSKKKTERSGGAYVTFRGFDTRVTETMERVAGRNEGSVKS